MFFFFQAAVTYFYLSAAIVDTSSSELPPALSEWYDSVPLHSKSPALQVSSKLASYFAALSSTDIMALGSILTPHVISHLHGVDKKPKWKPVLQKVNRDFPLAVITWFIFSNEDYYIACHVSGEIIYTCFIITCTYAINAMLVLRIIAEG